MALDSVAGSLWTNLSDSLIQGVSLGMVERLSFEVLSVRSAPEIGSFVEVPSFVLGGHRVHVSMAAVTRHLGWRPVEVVFQGSLVKKV